VGAHVSLLDSILAPVAAWVAATLGHTGHLGVVGLMAIESACIPLPSEIILPFSGYLVSRGVFNLHLAALAGAFGNLLGSWLAYALGYYGGRPFLERYGRYLLMKPHDLDLADRWFARYGMGAVFLGRVMPIVRTFISLPAGIARVSLVPFSILTFLGSWIWSYGLIYAGVKLGEHWDQVRAVGHRFDTAIALLIAVGLLTYLWRHLAPKRGNAAA
jgi:membrane protein DedA with SNARE-associated domain